jgi:hypothetical protein
MDEIERMERASEERFGAAFDGLPERVVDEDDHPWDPGDEGWWEGLNGTDLDQLTPDRLYDVVDCAKARMEEAYEIIRRAVGHPGLRSDSGFFEAYLLDHLRENINKQNRFNTDLNDLLKAIEEMEEIGDEPEMEGGEKVEDAP